MSSRCTESGRQTAGRVAERTEATLPGGDQIQLLDGLRGRFGSRPDAAATSAISPANRATLRAQIDLMRQALGPGEEEQIRQLEALHASLAPPVYTDPPLRFWWGLSDEE